MEADFQHYYRLDLRMEVDSMGARRLWALVNGLPPDAAVWRDGKRWTTAHEIAAMAVERADVWGRLAAMPHYKQPERLPAALEFSHPHRESKQKPTTRAPKNSAELAQALGIGR